MSLESLKDLYFDELASLYDAEIQIIRALPRLAEAARAPELREMLLRHGDESRLHLERLELIFTHWGEPRRPQTCTALAGIIQEGDARLHEAASGETRDSAIVGIAQRIEHYELAAYGSVRTYASRLNRLDEARLLQETLGEEWRTDHRLSEIAEAQQNGEARQNGCHARQPAPASVSSRSPADVFDFWTEFTPLSAGSGSADAPPHREAMVARGGD